MTDTPSLNGKSKGKEIAAWAWHELTQDDGFFATDALADRIDAAITDSQRVMDHTHLNALNVWCKSTGLVYPWVSFYADQVSDQWAVRIVAPVRGQGRPLRTMKGTNLELVCAAILPKAQELFAQQKAALERETKQAKKRDASAYQRDMREIEALHHTAEDF